MFFRCFAFLCVLAAIGATPAAAHYNYPFCLVTRTSGAEQDLIAKNDGPAPITVRVTLSGHIVSSDRTWPMTAVVPPYTRLTIGHVHLGTETTGGPKFDFHYVFGNLDAVHDEKAAYRLPFEDGRSFAITQAYGGKLTSHDNPQNLYAVDFAMPSGTPVVASRNGVIIEVRLHHVGHGPDASYEDKANTVSIMQDDGTVAEYAHLSPGAKMVMPGQRVEAGQLIGYSGNTGFSLGPHLHFVVYRPVVRDGKITRLSLPVMFYDNDPRIRFSAEAGSTVTANYTSPAEATIMEARQSPVAHAGSSLPELPPEGAK